MIDNYSPDGAALVRLPSSPRVWRAKRVTEHGWNGFDVPAFDSETALAILKAEGMPSHRDSVGHIQYWDADNGACELNETHDGLYEFAGWTWERVETVSPHIVEAVGEYIANDWDMDFITGKSIETMEAWLSDGSGHYAEAFARELLTRHAGAVSDEVGAWDNCLTEYPRVMSYVRNVKR